MKKSSLGRRPSNSKPSFSRLAVERSSRDRLSGIPVRMKKSESFDCLVTSVQTTNSIGRPKSAHRPDATPISTGPGFSGNRRLTTDRLTGDRHLLNSGSRPSSIGGTKSKKDNRPLLDKEWQSEAKVRIENILANDMDGNSILNANNNSIKPLSLSLFLDLVQFFFYKLDPSIKIDKHNYLNELPFLCKKMNYKGRIDRSWLISINTPHSWSHALGLLHFLASCFIYRAQSDPLDLMYPQTFEENDGLNFKLLLPYYVNSYELYLASPIEYDTRQAEYDEEIIKSHYEQDNVLEKLEELGGMTAKLEENRARLYQTKQKNRQTLTELQENNIQVLQSIENNEKYFNDFIQHNNDVEAEIKKEQQRSLELRQKIIEATERKNKVLEQVKNQKITQKDVKEMKKKRDSLGINLQNDKKFITEFETTLIGNEMKILSLKKIISESAIKYNLKLANYSTFHPELVKAELPNNAQELFEVEWKSKADILKTAKTDLEIIVESLKQEHAQISEKKSKIEITVKHNLKAQQEIDDFINSKQIDKSLIEKEIENLKTKINQLEMEMPKDLYKELLEKKEQVGKYKEFVENLRMCYTKSFQDRVNIVNEHNQRSNEQYEKFENALKLIKNH